MRNIVAPNLLPNADHFALLEDDGPSHLLGAVLALLRPGVTVTYGTPAPKGAQAITLAPETAYRADAPADLVFLPYVDRASWTWWTFAERMLPHLRPSAQPGGPIAVDGAGFLNFLLNWDPSPIELTDAGVAPSPVHYYPEAQNLANTRAMEIAAVRARLSDDRSQRCYDLITQGQFLAIWTHYLEIVFSSVQYFDYVSISEGDVVLSIGVDEGFETPALLGMVGDSGVVHHLDPMSDDRLYPYPRRAVAARPHSARFHRLAVSDTVGGTIIGLGWDGSALGLTIGEEQSDYYSQMHVDATTVDAFAVDQDLKRIDYINVDTEGAELRVLAGMRKVVNKFRPQLAISIYHSADEFWQVPMAVMEMCPDYDFYIEHYGFMCWDSLIYAIPKERRHQRPALNAPSCHLVW